jgi:hypothetical protein
MACIARQLWGHLDLKAPDPEEVLHLAVGIAAGKRPKAAPIRLVATGLQNDAHHGGLLQVFHGVTRAAIEVGRHRSGIVSMAQRQIIGVGKGKVGAMGAASLGLRAALGAATAGGMVVPGALAMDEARGGLWSVFTHGSARFQGICASPATVRALN